MNPIRIAAVVAAAILLAAPADAAEVEIKAKDIYFTPSLRVITVNDTVTWMNDGDLSHTVTSFPGAPRSFDSSPGSDTCDDGNPLTEEQCLEPGDRFEFTFTQPGIYDYYCKIHGSTTGKPTGPGDQSEPCGMCGRIDVRAPQTRPSPTSTPTLDRPDEASPSPTVSPSPSPSVSPEPTDDATGTVDPDDRTQPRSGGGGGGRALIAVLAIAILSGAGFLIWRRFLATG